MRKSIFISILIIVLCIALSMTVIACPYGVQVVTYDKDVNYLQEMYLTALDGSLYALKIGAIYEKQRNLKIQNEGLEYLPTSLFSSNLDAETIVEKIHAYMNLSTYTEEDLLLLSKVIEIEAGSAWLSDSWKLAVGEVVLNRVDSPEFPDTIKDVIEQPGQYYGKNSTYFKSVIPSEKSVELTRYLLEGNRSFPKSVVFQSNYASLGSGNYVTYTDKYLGSSYFNYSSNPELYE